MDNILFFLTPKVKCVHLSADDTLRQTLVDQSNSFMVGFPLRRLYKPALHYKSLFFIICRIFFPRTFL